MRPIEIKPVDNPRTPNRVIRVGTRGSKLALWQTNWIIEQLQKTRPGLIVEMKIFTTQGDVSQAWGDKPLQNLGDDGFFVRELEEALLREEIDLAVHSLKDLPHAQPEGLIVPCTPGREDARDILISKANLKLADLPQEAVIGTSSVRRASQLLAFRPDYKMVPLRGNVDTRIRKLTDQNLDGVILAAAGVSRLGRISEVSEKIPYKVMLPAPGQGAIAPECRANDKLLLGILAQINDREEQVCVTAEREFMAALGGGCQTPVAALAEILMRNLMMRVFVGSPDGSQVIRLEDREAWDGTLGQAKNMAHRLAQRALDEGARQILDNARAQGYITPRK
jgi:hydroxymethylbilane synthase